MIHRKSKTKRGFNQYQCKQCDKYFNEHTGTPYNYTHYPVDVIKLSVFLYYRYKLSFADVTELMAIRGIMVSHETIRQWAMRFGTDIGIKFRKGRCGPAPRSGTWI